MTVDRTVGCVGPVEERRVIEDKTVRSVDKGVTLLEGLLTATGAFLLVYGATSEFGSEPPCTGEDFCISASPLVAALGVVIMIPAGIATIVDVTAASNNGTRTETRTETMRIPELDLQSVLDRARGWVGRDSGLSRWDHVGSRAPRCGGTLHHPDG